MVFAEKSCTVRWVLTNRMLWRTLGAENNLSNRARECGVLPNDEYCSSSTFVFVEGDTDLSFSI